MSTTSAISPPAPPHGRGRWRPGRRLVWLFRFLRARYIGFKVRPGDIFVAGYPRSGSTLTQMLLHQITTDGEVEFDHIEEVVPWFERALVVTRQDLEALPSPRVFKTHLAHRLMPRGPCKYIYVVRDGKDVAVSYFNILGRYRDAEDGFARFLSRFLRGRVQWGSWFRHVARWTANRRGLDVLFVRYEDLVGDKEATVRRIAAFCGIDLAPEHLERILERTGFDYMKRHQARFRPLQGSLSATGSGAEKFIRSGRVGEGRVAFTEAQAEAYEREYRVWFGDRESPIP